MFIIACNQEEEKYKKLAGILGVIFLQVGLMAGSFSAIGF